MVKDDFLRAERFNSKLGIKSFLWIKTFVHSNILNSDVALAGQSVVAGVEEMLLINKKGEFVFLIEKD